MSNCTHTKWETVYEDYENWRTGEIDKIAREIEVSAEEDIDLHRYQCTICGKIGYYSGAAKNYYEKGVKSPGIKGLS